MRPAAKQAEDEGRPTQSSHFADGDMLSYFIMFCIAGGIIGLTIKNSALGLLAIAAITACWAVAFGPWAVATFVELCC